MALFFRRIIPLFAGAIMALNAGAAAADLKDSIHPSGEIWARYDFMDNYDFDKATKDRKETIFPRTRLALDFGFQRIGGRVQVQDFRRFGDPLKSFTDKSDTEIREAYADLIGIPAEDIDITIGRQAIDRGEGRILGSNDWHWIGRTHDAAIVTARPAAHQKWDAMFIKVNEVSIGDEWNVESGAYVAGLYASLSLKPFDKLEPYYFYQSYDSKTSPSLVPQIQSSWPQGKGFKAHTIGVLTKLDITEEVFLGFEGNIQAGDFGAKDLNSFLLHAKLGYETGMEGISSIALSYDIYSGDKDPNDGVINTYQPLFPSNYEHTGLIGWFGMKNLTDFRLSMGGAVFRSLAWKLDGHLFRAHRLGDGLYLPNNASYSYIISSKDFGRELDIMLGLPLTKDMTLTTTMSFLEPGKCFKNALAGAEAGTNTYLTAAVKWGF
ncbi:MAG: alginate export family protein [Deltaproteobacteria bacterium]|nr:alginate export family protein [Deltaproteobacteria bacterium]